MHFLKLVWTKWKKIAHRIGVFQSRVILSVFYFTILLPFGLILRSKDNLRIKVAGNSSWIKKENQSETIEDMRKQS